MDVYHHVFANALGAAIAREQIAAINQFIPGAKIHCGIVAADRASADAFTEEVGRNSSVEIIARAETGNEWVTLTKLHHDCVHRWPAKHPVLYCHTKGAHSSPTQTGIIPLWREWMEYFVFFRHQDALRVLEEGYSAYGFDAWLNHRRPLLSRLGFRPRFFVFSGNFWWSTAGAIRRIRLDGIDFERRHSAEGDFVSRIPGIRPFDALQLIGLPSIPGGAYTNYSDDFRHFPRLEEKASVLEEMRAALSRKNV